MESPAGFPQLPPEGSLSLRSQKPDARNKSFGQISHVSGPKIVFWGNLIFVRYHFSARKFKTTLKPSKNFVWRPKTLFFLKIDLKKVVWRWKTALFLKMFFGFLEANHAQPLWNYIKKWVLDPKRAKLEQKSEHEHVQHVPKALNEGEILQKKIFFLTFIFN